MEKLTLARAALAAIFAHARETHPDECCGAVVATSGRDEVRHFTNIQGRLHQENPADFPRDATTAYTPEPRELLAAIRAGEQPGARLAVFYHSHSKNGAYFSGEDQARAMFDGDPAYPEVTYLVVSDAREPDEARAFRWNETTHDFTEVELAVTGATGRKAAAKRSTRPAAKRSTPSKKVGAKKPTARKVKPKKGKAGKGIVGKAAKRPSVAGKRPARPATPVRVRKKPAAQPRRTAAKRPRPKARPRPRR